MDLEQACQVLGIPLGTTAEEAHATYIALSRKLHPDAAAGDSHAQATLNEAYELLSAYLKVKNAIVPVGTQALATRLQAAIDLYTAPSAGQRAQMAERRRTRRARSLRWYAWGVGAVAAALGFLEKVSTVLAGLGRISAEHLQAGLYASAVCLGLLGIALQSVVMLGQRRMESFLTEISDKRECARQLARVLDYSDAVSLSEDDLLQTRVLPQSHISVLLRRAVEHGLVLPDESQVVTPDFVQRYTLRFRPSPFRPKVETRPDMRASVSAGPEDTVTVRHEAPTGQKPRRLTAADSRSAGWVLVVLGVLFSLPAAWLALSWHTWLAAVPGVPALLLLIFAVSAFSDARRLDRLGGEQPAPQGGPSEEHTAMVPVLASAAPSNSPRTGSSDATSE